jgi:Protein of unknown function (DUF3618)
VSQSERSAGGSQLERIEHDLSGTRARLDATIGALRQKLSPGEMVDQAISSVKETGGGAFGRNLVSTVRANPVPVALVAVGLAWLMLSDWRGRDERRLPHMRGRQPLRLRR